MKESLSMAQQNLIWRLHCTGNYTVRGIGAMVGTPKSTAHDFIVGKTYPNFPRVNRMFDYTWKPKILVLDIETPNLDADVWEMFMVGHMWYGIETEPTIKTFYDFNPKAPWYATELKDAELTQYTVDLINEADMVVYQNGDEFDMRYIKARAMINRIERPFVKDVAVFDTMKVAKKHLRLTSVSLGNLCAVLKLKHRKGGVGKTLWRRAQAHNEFALEKIREYCGGDITTTADLFEALRPLDTEMPNLFSSSLDCLDYCVHCGSLETELEGTMFNKSTNSLAPALFCKSCKGWSFSLD